MTAVTTEMIQAFKEAWHRADEQGLTGARVAMGLAAALAVTDLHNPADFMHMNYAEDIVDAMDSGNPLVAQCGYERTVPPADVYDTLPTLPPCQFCKRSVVATYGEAALPNMEPGQRSTVAELRETAEKNRQAQRVGGRHWWYTVQSVNLTPWPTPEGEKVLPIEPEEEGEA